MQHICKVKPKTKVHVLNKVAKCRLLHPDLVISTKKEVLQLSNPTLILTDSLLCLSTRKIIEGCNFIKSNCDLLSKWIYDIHVHSFLIINILNIFSTHFLLKSST